MKREPWMPVAMLVVLLTGCAGRTLTSAADPATLARGGQYAEPRWSPDGKQLVTVHDTGFVRLEILNADGHSIRRLDQSKQPPYGPGWVGRDLIFMEGYLQFATVMQESNASVHKVLDVPGTAVVSWDQSGTRGVLMRTQHGDDISLWLLDVPSRELTQLSIDGAPRGFRISPSGHYLAYSVDDSSGGTLFIKDLQTGDVSKTWHVGGALGDVVWSPDEDVVGVVRMDSKDKLGFYLTSRDGAATPMQVTNFFLTQPDWSPVGDRIVYVSTGVPGENALCVLPLPTGWRERLFGSKSQ